MQKLQQQLGDLDEVWASDTLQQQLLALPYKVLKQLLQHEGTRVATENTVVYTIEQWYEAQQEQKQWQLQQLMRLVRMWHCTPYYAATVLPQNRLVQLCFEPSELLLVPLVSSKPGMAQILQSAKCDAMEVYPAWSAEKRPTSANPPMVKWDLELSALQSSSQQQQQHIAGGPMGDYWTLFSSLCVVRGQVMKLAAHIGFGRVSHTCELQWGLCFEGLPPNAVRTVSATTRMARSKAAAAPVVSFCSVHNCSCRGKAACLDEQLNKHFVVFGPQISMDGADSWEAVEAMLRQQGLVHPARQGGPARPHLQVSVEVHELL
jgi:hypothetical protein